MKKYKIILAIFVALYVTYFTYFSIVRYWTLYSSYFDLGIMHQTVYNTYTAIKTGNYSTFLELTNPHGYEQIKRMAIHNDLLLAPLSLFYFIYNGPETLLVIQTVILGCGAFVLFGIAQHVLAKVKQKHIFSLLIAVSYLFFPALQRANQYDFHAVTLTTTFLMCMYYFSLKRKYVFSYIFFVLSVLAKEEVALCTAFFGLYLLICKRKKWKFGLTIFISSVIWFFLSIRVIIPAFRTDTHFALKYYSDFGDSPLQVFVGILRNPASLMKYVWRADTLGYFVVLLGPVAFLSLLSPLHLMIALPEFGINLLSSSLDMRNIFYHYTSVITPFVFISAIYGFLTIEKYMLKIKKIEVKSAWIAIGLLIMCTALFSYLISPLPYGKKRNVHPFLWPQKEASAAQKWKKILVDENLKIMATGQIVPLLASRRYIYMFSPHLAARYDLADYIVLSLNEVYNYWDTAKQISAYEKLIQDPRYEKIYKDKNFEVFRKKI